MKVLLKRKRKKRTTQRTSTASSPIASSPIASLPEMSQDDLEQLERQLEEEDRIRRIEESIPPIFEPFKLPSRYKGAYGGRGSAKSWSLGSLAIIRCLRRPGTRIVCIREIQKTLSQSCKRLLEDTIARYSLYAYFRILDNHIETPGGGIVIFQGMQDHTAESIKSLEGFDIAWVEEAQVLSANSLKLLRPTLRKDDSEIWFSWNPRYETDPVDAFLRHDPPSSAIVIKANYSDNPYLPKVLRDELEWDRTRDIDKFEHVWQGEYERHSEARVFKNWRVEEFETPATAVFHHGGDWGFSVDPTVLVRTFLDGRKLYIDRECYKIGCEINHIPMLFDTLEMDLSNDMWQAMVNGTMPAPAPGSARLWTIVADSARPETISYLKNHGYPKVESAIKGPNSVKEGVIFLQGYDIIVHPRCVHTIDEFTHYYFKKDPQTDQVTGILEDKKNHVIDSVRYAAEKIRHQKKVARTMQLAGF